MLSLPPKLRSRGNEGRGECDGAVGGKKQELSLKREKRVNRGTYIPPKLANCSVNTQTQIWGGGGVGMEGRIGKTA